MVVPSTTVLRGRALLLFRIRLNLCVLMSLLAIGKSNGYSASQAIADVSLWRQRFEFSTIVSVEPEDDLRHNFYPVCCSLIMTAYPFVLSMTRTIGMMSLARHITFLNDALCPLEP